MLILFPFVSLAFGYEALDVFPSSFAGYCGSPGYPPYGSRAFILANFCLSSVSMDFET